MAAQIYLTKRRIPFTTSYHTRFPEYLHELLALPVQFSYPFLRWFHLPSQKCLVPTASIFRELQVHLGADISLATWTRGVDPIIFNPELRDRALEELEWFKSAQRPILLCVSRISREKNIEAFCKLNNSLGTKIVVGDGPLVC